MRLLGETSTASWMISWAPRPPGWNVTMPSLGFSITSKGCVALWTNQRKLAGVPIANEMHARNERVITTQAMVWGVLRICLVGHAKLRELAGGLLPIRIYFAYVSVTRPFLHPVDQLLER